MSTRRRAPSPRARCSGPRGRARRPGAVRSPSRAARASRGETRAIAGGAGVRGASSRARSAARVSADCGSGMRSRLSTVANAGKRANSRRRPSATCLPDVAAEVAPEQERLRRGPFLAHEQERQAWRQEQDRRGRAHRVGGRERRDPLAEGAIADLVVVLQEPDEGRRGQRAARLAARTPAMRRQIALIREALRETAAEMTERRLVVSVVAHGLAGDQDVQRVVDVIVPLGLVERAPTGGGTLEVPRLVRVVLEHEVHGTIARGPLGDGAAELLQDVSRASRPPCCAPRRCAARPGGTHRSSRARCGP